MTMIKTNSVLFGNVESHIETLFMVPRFACIIAQPVNQHISFVTYLAQSPMVNVDEF